MLIASFRDDDCATKEIALSMGFRFYGVPLYSVEISPQVVGRHEILVITSAHGLNGIKNIDDVKNSNMAIVGGSLAKIARDYGCKNVKEFHDVNAACAWIKGVGGDIGYVRGDVVARDIRSELPNITEYPVYRVHYVNVLPESLVELLPDIDYALFFSYGTANIFADLAVNHDVHHITNIAISPRVAGALRGRLSGRCLVARNKTLSSVMDAVLMDRVGNESPCKRIHD